MVSMRIPVRLTIDEQSTDIAMGVDKSLESKMEMIII